MQHSFGPVIRNLYNCTELAQQIALQLATYEIPLMSTCSYESIGLHYPDIGMPEGKIKFAYATALGITVAAEEIFKLFHVFKKGGDPLAGINVAVIGFGKVGSSISSILTHQNRAKLRAVATSVGTIFADPGSKYCTEQGFITTELVKLYREHGEKFINFMDVEVKSTNSIFSADVDLLIPAATGRIITKEVAENIRAAGITTIVPASYLTYTDEALPLLEYSGITCFPDFVANAGAMLACIASVATDNFDKILDLVANTLAITTRDLLLEAVACGCNVGGRRTQDSIPLLSDFAVQRAKKNMSMSPAADSLLDIAQGLLNRY